ncbi:MAG: His-Xaa-Ser system radical SAM maturase HxsC [Brevundimonas sp.]|uniref:His-Xaa-Ser system radical SAM maturase HxsC n=1 Tax=Brevundimonas sp. TaxID=1871086 RepID=UPI001A2A200C|nr:His-Xaa-Ser system radical SAM maturase HxsC [Brevundimonas sp.]MBJ7320404.1 His-Xaa-Ser system radical SAM maturase HxsC [Brevundimonas sp.]MDK2745695.1 His-Xaa-Ser system radical SAM maturase HxsC [Brevundimonas sp.]
MSLPLHTHGQVQGVRDVGIFKVLTPEEAMTCGLPPQDVLLWNAEDDRYAGSVGSPQRETGRLSVSALRMPEVVQPGDVIRLREGSGQISVLFRRGSQANTLFVTERCNSRCLMCSQPPRDDDDSWRVDELLRLIPLIDKGEIQLGMSGGEPTLLGQDLRRLIVTCRMELPDTTLHILTNGRLFSDRALADALVGAAPEDVIWAVPLYGDVAAAHDAVVDAENAFVETLQGLHEIGRLKGRVELRVVLHRMTVDRLPELASFIYRRLPFVEHIALMGLEPMGFTKQNRDRLWIDPVDYIQPLGDAVFHLANRGMAVSIYNLPLCILPGPLRPFARQSISDWKNTFAPECTGCDLISHCSGFFASAGPAWRSRAVSPVKLQEALHEMA